MGMTRTGDSLGRITACALVLSAALWLPQRSSSHHSATEYDWGRIVEVEGELVELRWQNPHVRLKLRSGVDVRGKPIIWDIETNSLSVMRRTNATPEKLRVGDRIR